MSTGQLRTTHRPDLLRLSPAAHRVLGAITAAGGRPYLVGGSVRDAVLRPGHPPKDVDIEVFGLDLDTLTHALRTVGYVDEVGRAFSVLKLRAGHGPGAEDFDVSVPRREVKIDGGHRGFDVRPDPHTSIEAATARRDFTVNALMYDPATGDIIDCWGGLADLDAGVLRHTTTAFTEDPLRVLRAAGFAARYSFTVHPETADLARTLAPAYAELSQERVWGEWHKIAARGRNITAALTALEVTGWLAHFPALAQLRGLAQDPDWHPEGDVLAHAGLAADTAARLADTAELVGDDRAVVVLAALLHDVGKITHTQRVVVDGRTRITSHGHDRAGAGPARAFLRDIGAPKHIRDRIGPLVAEHMVSTTVAVPTRAAVRRLARRLQPATVTEWALVVEADKQGRGPGSTPGGTGPWLDLAADLGTTRTPVPALLRGEHLIAAGLRPGPQFGPILAAALAAQDDGDFTDVDSALAWLTTHLASAAGHTMPTVGREGRSMS